MRFPSLVSILFVLAGCSVSPQDHDLPDHDLVAAPSPLHASQPIPVNRVISAAIWVNPADPSRSRVIITNATRGLETHDLDGYLLKHLDDGYETDSVTVLHDFVQAGKRVDLLLATYPDSRVAGFKVWLIDREKAKLKALDDNDTFKLPVSGEGMGIAAYHSPSSGKCYVFVTHFSGEIDQLELASDESGTLSARPVRKLKVTGKIHECLADADRGVIYVSAMKSGVWQYPAEPDAGEKGTLIIRANDNGLIPDVEGIGLYRLNATDGYLVVVGQGLKSDRSRINVYDRKTFRFVGAIVPSATGGNAIEFSAGIALTSASLPQYPHGLLVLKDHLNPNASEDFKYYSWSDIAGPLHLHLLNP